MSKGVLKHLRRIQSYRVDEDIYDALEGLSFDEITEPDIDGWRVFNNKERGDEFVALYSEDRFFVQSLYCSIDVLKSDLELITERVFDEKKGLNKLEIRSLIRTGVSLLPPFGAILTELYSIMAGDSLFLSSKVAGYLQNYDAFNPEVVGQFYAESNGGLVLIGATLVPPIIVLAVDGINKVVKKHKFNSSLSIDAETNYDFGKGAEYAFILRYNMQKLKSGEMSDEDFTEAAHTLNETFL